MPDMYDWIKVIMGFIAGVIITLIIT